MGITGCDSGPEYAGGPDGSAVNDIGCMRRNNFLERLLTECVTIEGVNEHLVAFQGFADDNDGSRVDGSAGFEATADYVAATLAAAGYSVTRRAVPSYERLEGSLRQLVPTNVAYETGVFSGSGFGDVTANVTAVDINLVPPRANTSGCEAADFAGFPAGNIALVQRGVCTFAIKAENAQAAGASAVIIFNQGDTPAREVLVVGTLSPSVLAIPVVGASFADGAALAQAGSVANVRAISVTVDSETILAERVGPSGQVIMAGAAMDTFTESPGLNNNGSGTAVLLEVAQNLANTRLSHTVRFAWWGAHTAGHLGSFEYLATLSQAEREAIALYLNFDAIGSPNYVRFVLDSDGSEGGSGVPGSAPVEQAFYDFYTSRGLAAETIPVALAQSDWVPFANFGIPFGSIHTGANGVKTAAEAATYGGTAGAQYDPCYQEACDTIDNVNLDVLDVNADAAAAVILHFGTAAELPAGSGGASNAHTGPILASATE
jgi:Zn-dependent M28 family amino/carboxypeptidase